MPNQTEQLPTLYPEKLVQECIQLMNNFRPNSNIYHVNRGLQLRLLPTLSLHLTFEFVEFIREMEIHRSDFPEKFIFGAATSAYQIEGSVQQEGRGPSSWDEMIRKNPGTIGDASDAKMASKSYYYYKEDVKLAKNIGIDSYRFSISWSRILPGGKLNGGVNKEGIQYYNNLIDQLLANGIIPFVTLHHFDLPQALEDQYGGFLSENIVKDFCDFAELCFWEFGDRVKHWVTFNEPWTFISFGYVQGKMPPNRGSSSKEHAETPHPLHKGCTRHGYPLICDKGDPGVEPYTVSHNLLMAHAQVFNLYKTKFKAQGGKIGITLVSRWFVPLTDTPADKDAAQRQLDFDFGWFMDPITYGQYPKSMLDLVPEDRLQPFSAEESKKLKGTYDFLGLNYYTSSFAADAPNLKGPPSYLTDPRTNIQNNDLNGNPIGPDIGSPWIYMYPKGLFELLCYIKKHYKDPPIYITENGVDEISDPKKTVCEARVDPERIKYHTEHLKEIKRAMVEDRVNMKGYFLWSLIDNFEWNEGYASRFGLVYVEFKNEDRSRFPKDSASWYMNFLNKKHRSAGYSPPNGSKDDDACKNPSDVSPTPGIISGEIVVHRPPSKRARN